MTDAMQSQNGVKHALILQLAENEPLMCNASLCFYPMQIWNTFALGTRNFKGFREEDVRGEIEKPCLVGLFTPECRHHVFTFA
jgi:hypothetical protein